MFKDRLKELRKEKGLSQQELADKIYVSRSAICKWEMGNGVPSEINIEALCNFFEVEEEWLFDREDLKEGIEITKKHHNVNIYNVILIILSFIFLIIVLTVLSTKTLLSNIKFPVDLWKLFNTYELLVIIGGLATSCGMGTILILNNNGFLTLNVDDDKRKKILGFGYGISIVLFFIFIFYLIRRLGNPNDYKSSITTWIIIEDLVLTFGVGLIILSYIITDNKFNKQEKIFTALNYSVFSYSLIMNVFCFINYMETKTLNFTRLIISISFTICSLITAILSLIIGLKNKTKNKIFIYTKVLTVLVTFIMFVLVLILFL